jgi:hypothetical protein
MPYPPPVPLLVHRPPDSFLSVRGPLLQWQNISRLITFADAYHSAWSRFELAQVHPMAAPVEYYYPEEEISRQDAAWELSATS